METPSNDEETLSEFLHRVACANEGALIDLWRRGGAEAVLSQEGGRLSEDHYNALLSGKRGRICKALMVEWDETEEECEDPDVELHGNPHFGPCWILVG